MDMIIELLFEILKWCLETICILIGIGIYGYIKMLPEKTKKKIKEEIKWWSIFIVVAFFMILWIFFLVSSFAELVYGEKNKEISLDSKTEIPLNVSWSYESFNWSIARNYTQKNRILIQGDSEELILIEDSGEIYCKGELIANDTGITKNVFAWVYDK
jgi:hypothetical protein